MDSSKTQVATTPYTSRPPTSFRTWVEIDLSALERNLGLIRQFIPSSLKIISILKADAYGHGLPEVASRIMQSQAADAFAVANVEEGRTLREIGAGWPILILSSVLMQEIPALKNYDLTATVSSLQELEQLNNFGKKMGYRFPAHIKVDTGMGRLGIWHEQAHTLIEQAFCFPNIKITGFYTHLSSADSDALFTQNQRQRFEAILKSLGPSAKDRFWIHTDNSAGLSTHSQTSTCFNAVRVGILQYGIAPLENAHYFKQAPEPVLSFHAKVGHIKKLPANTPISYNKTHTLKRDSRIAIITAGYADGIPRLLSNLGHVLLDGHAAPIIGNVTMDQTILDITDLPNSISVGDTVTLIGTQKGTSITATLFSKWAQTIPWEILCSITKRVPRIYKHDTLF